MWKDLIVCGGEIECKFGHLIIVIQNLVTNLIFLSTFLATAAFAYAGVLLLTSGGNPGKKDEAKRVFKKVLIGFLWILVAWLLIYTITSALLKGDYSLLGAPQ